jgi:putative membrane protein
MKKFLAPSMIALALCATPALAQDLAPMAGAPSTQPSSSDQRFIEQALRRNDADIAMSQLALQRSQQPGVRAFAQRMIDAHTSAYDTLRQLAEKDGIYRPHNDNARQQDVVTRLSTLSGPAFDRAYVSAMVRSNDMAVSAFHHEIASGQNGEIVGWAKTTLPAIQQHDQMARALRHTGAAAS